MNQKLLRIAGPVVFLIGVLIWLTGGARAGFSNDRIVTVVTDEITGIEQTIYEDGFEPGIEFIAVGFFGLSTLVAASAFFENKRNA
jgi:hypothetical protein